LPRKILERKLRKILEEDIGQGDITTALIVPERCTVEAEIVCKETGIVAGIEEAIVLLESLGLKCEVLVKDGEKIRVNHVLMKIFGDARAVFCVERTLLNIISRMSGIATATTDIVNKIREAGLKTKVACTRKTALGLLYFDKKAVLIGGGDTHRLHLDDMVLIKDNHIAVAGSVEEAIRRVKRNVSFSKKIEVEVTRIADVLSAAKTGVDIIMLDNFSPEQIEKAIKSLKKSGFFGKVLLEASGGITRQNILKFASTGVNIVSLGEITDSSKSLDISLEITKIKET